MFFSISPMKQTPIAMSSAKETRNHKEIQQWVESHKGVPAVIDSTNDKNKDEGILRIKFDDDNDNLEEISWEEFFEKFDEHGLTFLYQDDKKSRFNKFVYEEESASSGKSSRKS